MDVRQFAFLARPHAGNGIFHPDGPVACALEALPPRDFDTIDEVFAAFAGFDDDVEEVVSVSFDDPLIGQALLEACAGFERAGAKPVKIAATHAVSHKLEQIRPDEFYSGLHMAVLLANRRGALYAIEYSEFIQ